MNSARAITHVVGVRVVRPARVPASIVIRQTGTAIAPLERDFPQLVEVAVARKRGGVRECREERQEAHERDDEGAGRGREHLANALLFGVEL